MRRAGKTLKVLQDGHPRRLADGRNAYRKMSAQQRLEFLTWIGDGSDSQLLPAPLDANAVLFDGPINLEEAP